MYFSNYATISDLKIETCVDISDFAEKNYLVELKSDIDKGDIDKLGKGPSALTNLKSKVDKLDADKFMLVPVDLSKLTDVVKMMLIKRLNIMDWLKNANAIDTSGFVWKDRLWF